MSGKDTNKTKEVGVKPVFIFGQSSMLFSPCEWLAYKTGCIPASHPIFPDRLQVCDQDKILLKLSEWVSEYKTNTGVSLMSTCTFVTV